MVLTGQQLDSGDRLGGSGLVDVDVGSGGADDGVAWAGDLAQGEHVGACARVDEVGIGTLAEVLAQAGVGGGGPGVGSVGRRVAVVGGDNRRHHERVDAGVVVAGEAAGIWVGGGAQGCRERRWPFMRAPESEQMKARASAMCSAGVRSGLVGVGILLEHARGEDRVDDKDVGGGGCLGEGVGEGEGPGFGGGLGCGVGGVGRARVLRLR